METVVYLFTGFLEAGKTQFMSETLRDPEFNDGQRKILIITCEEGEEELTPDMFGDNVSFASFDDEQKLTPDRLSALQKRSGANVIFIEYNGMWSLDKLYSAFPEGWSVFQEILIADSTTILAYNANMRQLVVDKLSSCELVFFNRTDASTDKEALHKLVRAVSRGAKIIYEDKNGEVEFDEIEDPLPFDVDAPVIEISDIDFAIFYRDMSEDLEKYKGKRVRFKGICATDPALPSSHFAIGRHIMVCCEADIAYRGLVARGKCGLNIKTRDWVIVEGVLNEDYSKLYDGYGPVLAVEKIERAEKPEQEVATFY